MWYLLFSCCSYQWTLFIFFTNRWKWKWKHRLGTGRDRGQSERTHRWWWWRWERKSRDTRKRKMKYCKSICSSFVCQDICNMSEHYIHSYFTCFKILRSFCLRVVKFSSLIPTGPQCLCPESSTRCSLRKQIQIHKTQTNSGNTFIKLTTHVPQMQQSRSVSQGH